jgi:hypothetical protein
LDFPGSRLLTTAFVGALSQSGSCATALHGGLRASVALEQKGQKVGALRYAGLDVK